MRTVYNFVLNLPLKKLSTDRKVLKQIKKKKKNFKETKQIPNQPNTQQQQKSDSEI